MSIATARIHQTPIAVVDVETTGLHPRGDRVIEIAIVRVDPGTEPRVVLDTLVNPRRAVSATEIHGITDADVRDAPDFTEIAGAVTEALSGAVFASYNVYFDAKFVGAELESAGVSDFPPHLCLMYLRPALDLGARCTLADACRTHGVTREPDHVAAHDAIASAQLWRLYVKRMDELGIRTFADLARRKSYKFMQSFTSPPFNTVIMQAAAPRIKSRRVVRRQDTKPPVHIDRLAEYWDALKSALADLDITDAEIRYLESKRNDLKLTPAEIRSLHARAFTGLLASVSDDQQIDDCEAERVASMADALRRLGWRPGDRVGVPFSEPLEKPSWLQRLFG